MGAKLNLRILLMVCVPLAMPAGALPKSTKIDEAKAKLEQKIAERRTFDPIHHRGDLAIVLSTLGVIIGAAKLYVELRKHRKKKESAAPPPAPPIERGTNNRGAMSP